MPTPKKTSIQADYEHALKLEKEGNLQEAALSYETIVKAKPMFVFAQHRLMIVYRKLKAKDKEIIAIKKAIIAYKKGIETRQRQWLKINKQKADLSRELAQSLGLLGTNGLPLYQDENIAKWQQRLDGLSARIANAKIKKTRKR